MSRLFSTFLLAALMVGIAQVSAGNNRAAAVTFHFYGAEDCAPCMAFKRDSLKVVKASAARAGYAVAVNVIPHTRDVPKKGAFGDADGALRAAEPLIEYVYPPIFFISKNGSPVSAHGRDWEAAMARAEREAEKAPAAQAY